jgi:hypothetical protein
MPRKKKPKPQTFEEYAGYGTPEMRRRAIEAGCRTVAEMADWFDRNYGERPQREQNRDWPPRPYRRPAKP